MHTLLSVALQCQCVTIWWGSWEICPLYMCLFLMVGMFKIVCCLWNIHLIVVICSSPTPLEDIRSHSSCPRVPINHALPVAPTRPSTSVPAKQQYCYSVPILDHSLLPILVLPSVSFCFVDRVCLCNPSEYDIHYVTEVGLDFRASWCLDRLGLHVYHPSIIVTFLDSRLRLGSSSFGRVLA